MSTRVSIGDFSRMTLLSVKALRHYQELGLLRPAHIDDHTGYRRYELQQVPTAQVIRRRRDHPGLACHARYGSCRPASS